jgi:hypothetical protein
VVRDEKDGKHWQLVFPDGRVLKTIPMDSIKELGGRGENPDRDGDAPSARDNDGLPHH